MRILRALVISMTMISISFAQTTPVSPNKGIREKPPTLKAFTNVTIVISPTLTIEEATLLIRDGFIAEVGKKVKIPSDAEQIDLSGYTLYPGFIDPFTNYGTPKEEKKKRNNDRPLQFDGTRVGGNSWNNAIHSEKNWSDSFKPDKKESEKFLKLGYTAVQSCRLDGIFRGRSFTTLLGEGLPNDLILNPSSHHFASFNKGSSKQQYPGSLMGSIALIRQTFLDLSWYRKAKSAYAINNKQKKPEYNVALEAFLSVGNETIVFATTNELSLLRASRVSTEIKVPFIYLGSGYEYARLNEIKATGGSIILPLTFPETPKIKSQDDELDVNLAKLRHWETAPSNAAKLEEAGIEFALTLHSLKDKDKFFGNLRKAVKRGLSKQSALSSLTTIPAKMSNLSDLAGTLEKGKLANFFVTDGEIFEKKTKIYSIYVKGNKNKIKDMPGEDFRGNYELSFAENKVDLLLKGKLTKLTGSLKIGEDKKIKLSKLSLISDKLSFSASFDTLGIDGVTRFSGRKVDDNLSGYLTLPNGDKLNWTAQKISDYDPDADSSDKEEDSDDSEEDSDESEEDSDESKPEVLVANFSYPNKAYGFANPPAQQTVLVKNATVWTSESAGILKETDILVRNGKIEKIGKSLTAPKNALIIDATGKHITAGIIDEHSHIAISKGVNECTEAVTAEVRIGDVVNPDDIAIYRQLAGGTTCSQLLHGSCNPIGGQAQIIKLRWGSSSEEMKFENSPPSIKFALGENIKRTSWGDKYQTRYPVTRMGIENIIRDEFTTAREYEADWAAYNKLSSGKKRSTVPPRKDIELDAVLQILNSEMFIHCHSYVQSEILMLMRITEEFGTRVQTFTHILEGYKVAPEMAKHGATASTFADWWAYKFEVYDAIPYNSALMTEKGVISSVNSDNSDLGRRLNQDAAKAIKYGGMSQEEAIKLCTINPAIQLKIQDRVGSIKVGKDADFVIWNDNPLSIYAKVEQTWIDGARYFNLEDDLKYRAEIKEERNALIQKILKTKPDKKSKGSKKGKGYRPHNYDGYKDADYEWHCDDAFDYWERINNGY